MTRDRDHLLELRDAWRARWDDALGLWSAFTRLREPILCVTEGEERAAGLEGSFAMIRLVDQTVVVSLRQVSPDLEGFPLEVLGHEIGHHILCPANLSDNARLLARIRRSLPTLEQFAPMVSNLYADLLINDRLQRRRGLDMAGVYRALGGSPSPLWTFYLRTYEILWSLPRGTLMADAAIDDRTEGDALLGARLVRSFADSWLDGAGRFGALCLPYLMQQVSGMDEPWNAWLDAIAAGAGGFPDGVTEVDPDEESGAIHPALDPALGGTPTADDGATAAPAEARAGRPSAGQFREPFEYGQILRDSGLDLDDHEIAVRYYRERARRNLVPFPVRRTPVATDPLPEGVETWDVGDTLEAIDWTATALTSPVVIPGVTTVRRVMGTSPGGEPELVPLDLDVYVDSSGSMPNPQTTVSHLTLAGAIVALSALRAGASVQVTLWSGAGQFRSTSGFVRDEHAILGALTGFLGGGTAFPIHVLRDTYASRPPAANPAHVLVISDDGVDTMFATDERGEDGRSVARRSIAAAGGGATMVLNLFRRVEETAALRDALADGWRIHVVNDWEDLLDFARAFSAMHYAGEVSR